MCKYKCECYIVLQSQLNNFFSTMQSKHNYFKVCISKNCNEYPFIHKSNSSKHQQHHQFIQFSFLTRLFQSIQTDSLFNQYTKKIDMNLHKLIDKLIQIVKKYNTQINQQLLQKKSIYQFNKIIQKFKKKRFKLLKGKHIAFVLSNIFCGSYLKELQQLSNFVLSRYQKLENMLFKIESNLSEDLENSVLDEKKEDEGMNLQLGQQLVDRMIEMRLKELQKEQQEERMINKQCEQMYMKKKELYSKRIICMPTQPKNYYQLSLLQFRMGNSKSGNYYSNIADQLISHKYKTSKST